VIVDTAHFDPQRNLRRAIPTSADVGFHGRFRAMVPGQSASGGNLGLRGANRTRSGDHDFEILPVNSPIA
ncbi:MAG TPA: hypothetical protein PLI64_18290, partial [Phycisphaerae bacterium]|nr:hypothetical protein [Phycisphaerae bacterium]HQE44184.1 hypothetical protein [Phycisphaerae bacterium]